MPGKIKVKILAGRNLPVMDRSGDTTDAYVELKFGNVTFKTDVCRKSLNPQWNSEWYRFEVDDSELQDEPLQIRLMDHDTYSANDAIGKVYINLNPLMLPGVPPTVKNMWTLEAAMNTNTGSQGGSVMTGWIPVYDTMHGIRGEVKIIVKVELISDFNKFRQSSCGVQFFYSPNIPHGYHTQSIHGFVEELVVSDDPEYKWIDKIRTPRASNEARQTLFFKLSGEVQRKIGLKALDLGGNAVIGYLQNFDLEGESGIVIRGIGTAVTLVKLQDPLNPLFENIEEAFFSQHKAQKERAGLDESVPVYPFTPTHIPDPHITNTRVTRARNNFPYFAKAFRSSKQTATTTECPCADFEDTEAIERLPKTSGLKKSAVSYASLSESVVQDERIRSMLALEDERGEGNKSILDVRMKNLKKLFNSSDSESKIIGPRFNTSARSSIISIPNLKKEKTLKKNKGAEGITALLIKSIHNVPLENVKENHETHTGASSNDIRESSDCSKQQNVTDHNKNRVEEKGGNCKDDVRIDQSKVQTKREHDSSFEENTPSSEDFSDESSIDSTSYDVLHSSKFSTDEELETNNKFTKGLTRINTFPPLRTRSSQIRLQRVDSDMRPLHEENVSPLIKYLSTNQVLPDLKFTTKLQMDFVKHSCSPTDKTEKKEKPAMTVNVAPKATILEIGFDKNVENELIQSQQSIDNSQDFSLPLATSTPVETRPPFFPEVQEHDSALINTENESTVNINDNQKYGTSSKEHIEIPGTEVCTRNTIDYIEYDQHISADIDNINDNLSYADESEASVSAYSLLQSASDTDSKDVKLKLKRMYKENRYPSLLEEKADYSPRGSFKNNECLNKFTSSMDSLSSLQKPQFPLARESNENENMDNKMIESASKTSSSIESLIQSSCNDIHDVTHNNRRRRMLDLMRIIDTKMMEHSEDYNDHSNCRFRKKRRDRICTNFNHRNLCKSLHNRCLKKRLATYKHAEAMHPSPVSTNLPPNESTPAPLTPDSSSYNSSLESIITSDMLIQSRSYKTKGSLRSKKSFLIKGSSIDPNSHEIAATELTIDTQSSDSLRNDGGVLEMKELKSTDTNPLVSPSSVDHAVHESHSICNISEISDHDEFTNITNTANMTYNSCVSRPSPDHRQRDEASVSPSYPLPAVPPMATKVCQLPATKTQPATSLHRRSSDSDLSITPKGNSFGANDRSMTGILKTSTAVIRTMNQDAFEMLEYPFITMQQYPPGFILHIGGLVSSRSVKLLERISNLEEPESRDAWWKEVRMEVRSHARALACNVVIGYREETSICDDVCVLNAYGTAAVINLHNSNQDADNVFFSKGQSGSVINPAEVEREKAQQKPIPVKAEKTETDTSVPTSAHQTSKVRHTSESKDHEVQYQSKCNLCHLPYNEASVPFRVNISKCAICRRARVPDVMFTTIELPENLSTTGLGCIIQATTCKSKKDLRGELNAKEISDSLPFLEYELHSLLLNKLKVKGMNAVFGLKLQVSLGERLIVGMAVGTAVYLTALLAPSVPRIASNNSWQKEEQLAEIQKTLVETVVKNREFYRLKPVGDVENGRVTTSDTDESDEDLPDLDFSVGARDTCVLEVDDIEDMDRISLLMDDRPPDDFHVVNIQKVPGLDDLEIARNLQMFTQISRTKIPAGQTAFMPSKYFAKLLQSVYFKLRKMIPCALCDMQFKLALPEPDEIQFTVIGMALGLGDPIKANKSKKKVISHSVSKDQVKKTDDSEMIFNLDVDHAELSSDNASNAIALNSSALINTPGLKSRTRSPMRTKVHPPHKHKRLPLNGIYGVDITPLSYLPGGHIDRYLGNLNFFFIRESTSIRENGGLSGFTHSFVMEVLAIVRAHITALGGNAMVAFFMTKCVLLHSPHKNQGQCLINVGGDVVSVLYSAGEKHCGSSNC